MYLAVCLIMVEGLGILQILWFFLSCRTLHFSFSFFLLFCLPPNFQRAYLLFLCLSFLLLELCISNTVSLNAVYVYTRLSIQIVSIPLNGIQFFKLLDLKFFPVVCALNCLDAFLVFSSVCRPFHQFPSPFFHVVFLGLPLHSLAIGIWGGGWKSERPYPVIR